MNCPYCNMCIELEKVNCGILRCGIYKLKNGKVKQLPKHGKQNTIEKIIKEKRLLFGCGNPIKYNKQLQCFDKTTWDS